MNLTLSLSLNFSESQQSGTNLGLVLHRETSPKLLYLRNNNFDDVECLVAVVLYNSSSPVVGGCSKVGTAQLMLEETKHFIVVQTPNTKWGNKNGTCQDQSVEYATFYTYLEQLNFGSGVYFEGIEKFLFASVFRFGYQVSQRLVKNSS
jgi:hypothetical protein